MNKESMIQDKIFLDHVEKEKQKKLQEERDKQQMGSYKREKVRDNRE